MIVAGEASGDGHAAKLANAIRDAAPDTDFEFFGAAGPKMRDAGVEAVVQSDALAIVGLAEIGRALPMFLRAKRDLKRAAADKKPVIVILVDFPDFNLKLAKALKKQGLMVVYYISPQLWAWRKYRVSTVRKYVDLLLTILPFEKDWYAGHGVAHVEYVGNPLAREVHAERTREEFRRDHGLDPTRPLIAMLPVRLSIVTSTPRPRVRYVMVGPSSSSGCAAMWSTRAVVWSFSKDCQSPAAPRSSGSGSTANNGNVRIQISQRMG